MIHNKIYITIVVLLFVIITIVFNTFPRTTFSELEKRELTKFPEFSVDSLKSGAFTNGISSWFNDSEPYREQLIEWSMMIKSSLAMFKSEDDFTFHAADEQDDMQQEFMDEDGVADNRNIDEYTNKLTAKEKTRIANAGIIVFGEKGNVRALMSYKGVEKYTEPYAEAVNHYYETFGPEVQIYSIAIPTAVEFYCPDKAKTATKSERPSIIHYYNHLDPNVHAVDAYTTLAKHADEGIYLRTDHHWAPLGAYYAAKQFAKSAKVPFIDIADYEKHVVHGFVGSMFAYSKDITVKQSPEDFVYYTPKNVQYTTTIINYTINSDHEVVKEAPPVQDEFFHHHPDGSSGAYNTFMGGDSKLVHVHTNMNNGRRLVILKDSYGNAIPGYLFGSFEDIHVIDFRYFNKNLVQYVKDNNITDILFANSIFAVCTPGVANTYRGFLTQTPDNVHPTHLSKIKDKKNKKNNKKGK